MSLIAMAVFDTDENERSEYTYQTLYSLRRTVDLNKHRLFVINNNSCRRTKDMLDVMSKERHHEFTVINLPENIGTAEAVNLGWKHKLPGENLIKMDNDCVVHSSGWVDEMDRAIERTSWNKDEEEIMKIVYDNPKIFTKENEQRVKDEFGIKDRIGIVGLKRKDLWENPFRNDAWHSDLKMLPHESGQSWIIVEEVKHVIGTCQMYSAALIEKIGYLYQPGLYGYDDVLASHRSQIAGFYNCFLPHIEIEHIDQKETPHWQWKRDEAEKKNVEQQRTVWEYHNKKRSIYYNPYEK